MPRVKRGTVRAKKRAKLLKNTKGYMWGRKSHVKVAKEAILHAGNQAYQARHKKKGEFRAKWHIQINAAVRAYGTTYSKFMDGLKKAGIKVNRKMLSELANKYPEVFKQLVEKVKK